MSGEQPMIFFLQNLSKVYRKFLPDSRPSKNVNFFLSKTLSHVLPSCDEFPSRNFAKKKNVSTQNFIYGQLHYIIKGFVCENNSGSLLLRLFCLFCLRSYTKKGRHFLLTPDFYEGWKKLCKLSAVGDCCLFWATPFLFRE